MTKGNNGLIIKAKTNLQDELIDFEIYRKIIIVAMQKLNPRNVNYLRFEYNLISEGEEK